jgi:hypothetical protein
MNTTISLPEDVIRDMVAAALAEHMTDDKKTELIATAVKELLGKKPDRYGSKTFIEKAVESAMERILNEQVYQILKDDQRVKDAITAACDAGIKEFAGQPIDDLAIWFLSHFKAAVSTVVKRIKKGNEP